VLTVALAAGRHVVIEGPPGTGKSTLLREVARDTGQAVIFVEGNAELTPARLVGQHDPAQVLAGGYTPDSFTDGPLLTAMRGGALLYLEEFNRIPEETLNVLITVLAEGEIAVPRLGMVAADPGFRLIAAMNPFDAIGTARIALNDNLLKQCSLPEIRAVMAHEMGHYVLNHAFKLILYFSLFVLGAFVAVEPVRIPRRTTPLVRGLLAASTAAVLVLTFARPLVQQHRRTHEIISQMLASSFDEV
jgi:midasin (ATPase involved in ribosome maturation)